MLEVAEAPQFLEAQVALAVAEELVARLAITVRPTPEVALLVVVAVVLELL